MKNIVFKHAFETVEGEEGNLNYCLCLTLEANWYCISLLDTNDAGQTDGRVIAAYKDFKRDDAITKAVEISKMPLADVQKIPHINIT